MDELLADIAEIRRRGYAMDDEETMEGVVCYGVVIPSRQTGDGPFAASITLLKVRATAERVPALIDDLHWLANELSDPSRRHPRAGRRPPRSRRRPPLVRAADSPP